MSQLATGDPLGLDPADREFVELLTDLGVDHKVAKVLAHLHQVPDARSKDLERACGLRQPEVSLATQCLRDEGWVRADERKQGGKGRPVHHYVLETPLPEILRVIEERKRREMESELSKIERLKKLVEG